MNQPRTISEMWVGLLERNLDGMDECIMECVKQMEQPTLSKTRRGLDTTLEVTDTFRVSNNIGGSQPISTMNTVSPICNRSLSTSSLSQTCMENHVTTTSVDQTVFNSRNTVRCFATARSTMVDNVDRIPAFADIIGHQDMGDRTSVPIRRIFDRFRSMRTPRPQPNYVTRVDITCHMVSKQPLTMLNHAYLCMDANNHIGRPQIIYFQRSDGRGRHQHHLPTEYSRDRINSASNELFPSNCHRRKKQHPLSAARSRNASSRVIGAIGPPRPSKDGWHNSSIVRRSGTGKPPPPAGGSPAPPTPLAAMLTTGGLSKGSSRLKGSTTTGGACCC
ncbi:hypothetical protein Tco_0909643 [Tanacetum coccineum]|uniref:Uncharacterized protein n=1 Tax=Tanacetum coccineum TaxID=301880 RepID=A0ABQ5CTW5_9ASTR